MRRLFPAAALAAGCFSTPPYEPKGGVTFTEAGTGAIVAGPNFSLRFADGPGFHFPDELKIFEEGKASEAVNLIGRDPAQTCYREDEVGILIAPTTRLSTNGATPSKNVLVNRMSGPAVVQVKLEWETVFSMCDPTRSRGGTSTFTIFPDGRIVRRDAFDIAAGLEVYPVPCACEFPPDDPDRLFRVITYWTLARSAFRNLYAPDPEDLPAQDVQLGSRPTSCANNDTYQVVFAWDEPNKTRIRGAAAQVAFGYEMDNSLTVLDAYTATNDSAMFIERSTCDKALRRAEAYRLAMEVTVDKVLRTPSPRDGIYGGDNGVTPPGIEVSGTQVEVIGPAPAGFAVWLRFPSPVKELRATRDLAMGEWYLPQRVDDDSWIVWFRDSLPAGQTITIEPR